MDVKLRLLRTLEKLDYKIWSEQRKMKTEKNQKIRHRLFKRIGSLKRKYQMTRQKYLECAVESQIRK